MSSDYTGNPRGEQPPAAIPSTGVDPIIVLPVGTDPFNVDTMFVQQYKVIADYIAYLQVATQGFGPNSFFLYDDFTGSTGNTGKWDTVTGLTFPADPANGGLAVMSANGHSLISGPLVLRVLNFTFEASVRWPNYANVNASDDQVGIINLSTPASNVYFRVYRDGGGGSVTHNITLYEGASAFDAGRVVNTDTYSIFKITRLGSVLTWQINGITVRTNNSFTTDFDYGQVFINSAGAGDSKLLYCDYVKFTLPTR